MADVKAACPSKFFPTPMCFNGGRLGPLDAKTYVKASLAFEIFPTPTSFNGECESIVGLRNFCQHLCVLMEDVKASFAFKIIANTYVF
jgi:hypothetical protein